MMEPANGQPMYGWTAERAEQPVMQPYLSAPPVAGPSHAPPMYMHTQVSSSREGSIMPTQPYEYHNYTHLQGPSAHVMIQQQQQQQQQHFYEQPPRHHPMAEVHQQLPAQLSPGQCGEMPYVPVDYSQCRTYTSSARSTLRQTPITMRKRRAPYIIPDTNKPREQRQDGLSAWDTPSPSVQAPTPPKEELVFHEDMPVLQETSLSASQSVPSPIESRPLRPPALTLPTASEAVTHVVWADEQAKPAPQEDDCSSSPQPSSPAVPGTVFIHSNVPRTSTSAADANEDYEEYRSFFPDDTDQHRRLRIALHDVMTSEWKVRNELEPTSRDLLQFSVKTVAAEGSATFKCLMYHNKEPCKDTWNRAERVLAHLRRYIDLRPFTCEGDGTAPCQCGLRFFSEDTLQQHRKNIHTIRCEYCDSSVTPRNKTRHLRQNCAKSPFRV